MPLAFEAVTKPSNIGYDSIMFNVYRKKTIVVAAASSIGAAYLPHRACVTAR